MSNNYSSNTEADNELAANGAMPVPARSQVDVPANNMHTPSTPPSSDVALPETGDSRPRSGLAPGTVLSGGRYTLERLIASGGMGAVYRAIDGRFKRPCAVKELLDTFRSESERAQALEWFEREATLLLELNHPCIPRVRDFFTEYGRHYLVMDFIDGYTLAEMLEREASVLGLQGTRGITEQHARGWMRQVSSVLSYLHSQSPPIIFRDLKPSNVMVTVRDEIKLIDFGIARTFQSQHQATVIMTIGYAAPEQLYGQPEPRSDIYALGATIYRLLTRRDASKNKPTLFSFLPIRALRPDVSPAFERVLMKALAPELDQRWTSAAALERALLDLPPVTVVPTLSAVKQEPLVATEHAFPSDSKPDIVSDMRPGPISGANLTPVRPVSGSLTGGPAGQYITAALGHLAAKRIDAAYEAVQLAHTLEPDNALVHQIFGQVFARRTPPQVDLALQAYNRSLELNAGIATTHKLIGDVGLFLRQVPLQAIPSYVQALRINPRDLESHDRLAQCYEKTNQVEPAVREYQQALSMAPPQPEILRLRLYFSLGQVAMRANQWSIAEHAFVQILMLNAADAQARFLLSQVYEREGKLEDAFRECGYVINGPLGGNPAVQQLFFSVKNRLGR
jgi:serine/threonine protein kinase